MCELRINKSEIVILVVCFQLKQLKRQPEKNSGLNGSPTACSTSKTTRESRASRMIQLQNGGKQDSKTAMLQLRLRRAYREEMPQQRVL